MKTDLNFTLIFPLSGLCLGDSGGPLFKTYHTKDGSRMSVLIGVVSRGTGSRGNCGGLNNATHYVRIKMFLDWIMVSLLLILATKGAAHQVRIYCISNTKILHFFSDVH